MKITKKYLIEKFIKLVDNLPDNFGVISGNIELSIQSTIHNKPFESNIKYIDKYTYDTNVLSGKNFTRTRESFNPLTREITKIEIEMESLINRPN